MFFIPSATPQWLSCQVVRVLSSLLAATILTVILVGFTRWFGPEDLPRLMHIAYGLDAILFLLYYAFLSWRHTQIVIKRAKWDNDFLYPYQVALEVVAHYQINGSCSQNLVAVGEDRPEYVWETKIRKTRNFRARPLDYLEKCHVHARLHRRLLAWCTSNIPFSWELLHDRQTESAGGAEDAQDIVTLTMYEADTVVETLEHMRIIVDALAKYETPPSEKSCSLKEVAS